MVKKINNNKLNSNTIETNKLPEDVQELKALAKKMEFSITGKLFNNPELNKTSIKSGKELLKGCKKIDKDLRELGQQPMLDSAIKKLSNYLLRQEKRLEDLILLDETLKGLQEAEKNLQTKHADPKQIQALLIAVKPFHKEIKSLYGWNTLEEPLARLTNKLIALNIK